MDVERELRRLIDIEAIRNRIALYGHLADGDDSQGFGALFAEDGVLEWDRPYAGRAAITALHAANVGKAPGAGQGHVTVNSVIEVDGDTATARSYANGGAQYHDQWRRVGDAWLIQRRVVAYRRAGPVG
jgi:hypothetical protein